VRLIFFCFLNQLLRDLEKDDGAEMQININKLVSYCMRNMESKDIDILNYLKRNETVYPTLVMMARDIFTVPMSSLLNPILVQRKGF
jgi:hAT family C-terminal dimerisation region